MPEKQTRKTRLYDRAQVIRLLSAENPRRSGSNRHSIFAAIEDGITVDEFLFRVSEYKGGTEDLQILEESGHIEIEPLPQSTSVQPEGISMVS